MSDEGEIQYTCVQNLIVIPFTVFCFLLYWTVSMAYCKTAVSPVHWEWRCCSLVLNNQCYDENAVIGVKYVYPSIMGYSWYVLISLHHHDHVDGYRWPGARPSDHHAWCWLVLFKYHMHHWDNFVYASNQWETTFQCNIVSHWLGAFTK